MLKDLLQEQATPTPFPEISFHSQHFAIHIDNKIHAYVHVSYWRIVVEGTPQNSDRHEVNYNYGDS